MNDGYKIRLHKAIMETKYGEDAAYVFEDLNDPPKSKEEVLAELMDMLGYEPIEGYDPSEDENDEYPGYCNNGQTGASFEYIGGCITEIPASIVKKIRSAKTE